MHWFIISVTFYGMFAFSNAFPQGNQDELHPDRIVGGEDALQGEFPYQISLRYYYSHICGASLVMVDGIQVVLTAAHCVDSGNLRHYTVMAGELDRSVQSNLEQTRNVSAILAHDNYNAGTFANDIAVILLSSPFDVNKNVKPIDLPQKGKNTTGDIVVSGWGTLQSNGDLPDVLQKVTIPVILDDICQQAYVRETILPSMLCAGILGVGGKDSCQGDSGGPLAVFSNGTADYLAGIVSWGYGCADPEYPGVNTEVSKFIGWIEEQVRSQTGTTEATTT